jgi:hypothetical protein
MLVPAPVQQQIAAQAPLVAYVPSRLPAGWRFSTWTTTGSMLEIDFRRTGGGTVQYFVTPYRGACSAGSLGSSGGTFWARTVTRLSAWRCVDGKKLSAELFPAQRLTKAALLRFIGSARHLD